VAERGGTLASPSGAADAVVASTRRAVRWPAWLVMLAVLLVAGGTAGAWLVAGSVARNDTEKSHRDFDRSSAAVASTLQLAIVHEQDLTVSASAFIRGNPDGSNGDFIQWANSVQALERYPELQGFGYAVIVPASQLAAFAVRATKDATGSLAPDGTLPVFPAGSRPFYCLAARQQVRDIGTGPAARLDDFCAISADLLPTRDSGLSAYLPIEAGPDSSLAIEMPIYRGGVVPATSAARHEAFLGWVGILVVPQMLLDRALQGNPGMAVTFSYHQGLSNVTFQSRTSSPTGQRVTIDLHNGWTVTTSGVGAPNGVFANTGAVALLLAGAALSVLLATLTMVLGTGRARALRLVAERTSELRHLALHDALTGLPNRALIMDRIEQLLARNRRHGTHGAVLFVDLDEFKNINDTLGHAAGDQLLVAVAARLVNTLRDSDTIGRMGGDEFVVLIDGGEFKADPHLVAERLLDVMRQPFELDDIATPLIVNTSIGVAIGDRASAGELLRDADVALYQAKGAGKNRYEVFHPAMQTEISQRIELEFDLRTALEGGQFRLVYQPIYNLNDLTLVGVEALLRWEHPTRGLVLPDEFIPILEHTGQIRDVGRWVLRQACQQMAVWHARGDTLDVSVNVSGRQLDDDAIVGHIRDALTVSGLPATFLIIEVTETALMHNAYATGQRLHAIKDLGVSIAVDDFGTGYSSLAYLQQFPVDCLKIDRTFTNAMTTSREARTIVGTLVQLGKDLGLRTLAEGVETAEQMDYLRGEHVNDAQGFLLARPLDPDALEAQILAPTRSTAEPTTDQEPAPSI
jgi:diguanylate cyclase (GGDEF)-like protein